MTTDITQADRELLAAEYKKSGDPIFINYAEHILSSDRPEQTPAWFALRAIAAARRQAQGGGEVCAHHWHDYGQMNVSWCHKCEAKAVTGYEDRPFTAPPSAPVAADWITGDGLQGIKAEAHFLTQHKEEAVQRAGKRLLDRADKIIAALCQPPSAPVGAAQHWHDLYRKECLLRQDDAARYGQQIADLEALAQQPAAVALPREELDTCRQWFASVQDTNAGYLIPDDYFLAEKLYRSDGSAANAAQHQEPTT